MVASSSERLVRAAIARLEAVGLVAIGETGIIFAANPSHLKLDDTDPSVTKLHNACRRHERSSRRLPLPRLMLRHIARGAPPAVAATVMGHLVRSVRWMEKEIHLSGSCPAGFISDFFGVDLRSVRRARAYLREIGWLVRDVDSDWDFGGVPNLTWSLSSRRSAGSQAAPLGTDLSPPRPKSGAKLSPPTYTSQLRSGSRYLQPCAGGLTEARRDTHAENAPNLEHVVWADLQDARRLWVLFEQAAQKGVVKRTQADRLRFFTAAERAKRLGTRNPCGFFAAIVRGGIWRVLSQQDEDRAHGVLKKLERSTDVLAVVHSDGPSSAAKKTTLAKAGTAVGNLHALISRLAADCSISSSAGAASVKGQTVVVKRNLLFGPAARVPVGRRSPSGRRAKRALATGGRVRRGPGLRTGFPKA